MSRDRQGDKVLIGQVFGENDVISIADLCRCCMVETETVTTLVSEGILDPLDGDTGQWRFNVGSIRRVRTVVHLQRDLGVNLAGAALALELLDQIAELKRR